MPTDGDKRLDRSSNETSLQPQLANNSQLGKICLWIATFIWCVTFAISFVLYLVSKVSGEDHSAENLGLWVITRYGPLIEVSGAADEPSRHLWVYVFPMIFDIAWGIAVVKTRTARRFAIGLLLFLFLFLWFGSGVLIFVAGIRVA